VTVKKHSPRATRIWLAVFGVWGVFLTGALGSPGLSQSRSLHALLDAKQAELGRLEAEVERLVSEAERLEKSRTAQEREIRRVLGYAAPDDLIFDFGQSEQLTRL